MAGSKKSGGGGGRNGRTTNPLSFLNERGNYSISARRVSVDSIRVGDRIIRPEDLSSARNYGRSISSGFRVTKLNSVTVGVSSNGLDRGKLTRDTLIGGAVFRGGRLFPLGR